MAPAPAAARASFWMLLDVAAIFRDSCVLFQTETEKLRTAQRKQSAQVLESFAHSEQIPLSSVVNHRIPGLRSVVLYLLNLIPRKKIPDFQKKNGI